MILFATIFALQTFPSGLENYGKTPPPAARPKPRPRAPVAQPGTRAPGKPARCTLRYGEANWAGRCRVLIERGGTFTVNPWDGERLPGNLLAISVAVIAPGQAEIRGLTENGINARWGPAMRSQGDPACWEGSGYSVCAY